MDLLKNIDVSSIAWKSIKHEGLDLDYSVAIPINISKLLFRELEDIVEYFTGDLACIK